MKKDNREIDKEIEVLENILSTSNEEINSLKVTLNALLKKTNQPVAGDEKSDAEKSQPLLFVNKLTKTYSKDTVVNDVEFTLEKGKFYGLIGPNGAGKTTLIKLLMSAIQPKSGNARVENTETKSEQSLSRISYITEKSRFPRRLTVKQFYDFLFSQDWDKMKNWRKDFLKYKNYFPSYDISLNSKLTSLSSGMQKIVILICALIEDREILVLDEPAENMDYEARTTMFNLLQEEVNKGKIVFLSSHNLKEIQKYLDFGIFMNNGNIERIVDLSSPDVDLAKTYSDIFGRRAQ